MIRRKPAGARAVVGAAAVAIAMAVAACTGASDPTDRVAATTGSMSTTNVGFGSSTTGPSRTTSTGSPTSGAAGVYPTDVPAAARANTTEGAKEFAKYYLELVNIAYTTPKAGLLPPLASASCQSCVAYEDSAVAYVAKGHRYDRPALQVQEVAPAWDDKPGGPQRIIDVTAHQNAANIVDSSNKVLKALEPGDFVFVMSLSWSGSGWMVDLVQVSR